MSIPEIKLFKTYRIGGRKPLVVTKYEMRFRHNGPRFIVSGWTPDEYKMYIKSSHLIIPPTPRSISFKRIPKSIIEVRDG